MEKKFSIIIFIVIIIAIVFLLKNNDSSKKSNYIENVIMDEEIEFSVSDAYQVAQFMSEFLGESSLLLEYDKTAIDEGRPCPDVIITGGSIHVYDTMEDLSQAMEISIENGSEVIVKNNVILETYPGFREIYEDSFMEAVDSLSAESQKSNKTSGKELY